MPEGQPGRDDQARWWTSQAVRSSSTAYRRGAPHRALRRRRRVRRRRVTLGSSVLIVILGIVLATCTAGPSTRQGGAAGTGTHPAGAGGPQVSGASAPAGAGGWNVNTWLAHLEAAVRGQPGHLQAGSEPSVLPGPVLIADEDNARLLLVDPLGRIIWQFPNAGGPGPGQQPLVSDDAFFGPHGRHVIATEESRFTISVISLRKDAMSWQYGHPGVAGAGAGYLDNPDDAMLLPNGDVMTADIKNCRLLLLGPGSPGPLHVFGETTPYCDHQPPARFGSPNGVFPMADGNWLVSEINGDWVDDMTPSGQILWSVHPPGVQYPSDSNQIGPDVFLTVDYSQPGQVETFTSSGRLLWRYRPTGAAALDHPSLALPLPNGDVLFTDDRNDRVVVVDPRTNQVVWQYGVKGAPGSAPGYLAGPDGADLAPPFSLLGSHAATMGIPPWP